MDCTTQAPASAIPTGQNTVIFVGLSRPPSPGCVEKMLLFHSLDVCFPKREDPFVKPKQPKDIPYDTFNIY